MASRSASQSSEALGLAKELELTLSGKEGKNTGFRPKEIMGNHLHSDATLKGTSKGAAFGLSSAGAVCGVIGAAPSIVGAVGMMGALYFVTTTVKSGLSKFSGKKYK